MDIKTKQRLVGAVVLVSLLVIFLPMILTGGGQFAPDSGARSVSEGPEYQFEPLPVPDEVPSPPPPMKAERESTPSSQASAGSDAAGPERSDRQTGQESLEGWVVQVGSFSEQSNANALRDKLREMDYTSFVETTTDDGKRIYRVRVGPEVSREQAEAVQGQLVKDGQAKGLIMAYP